MSVFDAAIIGSGPAGLSAALTLKARGRSVLWLGDRRFSDKVRRAERVNNYPGLPAVTGSELAEAFLRHAEAMGLSITEGVASGVSRYKDGFLVSVGSELYEAKTVLLATGVAQVGLLPGEEEFLGRGVSWCATCDGMLYRGKTIAVISTDERFDPEVRFLANLAGKTYLLPRYKTEAENAELVSEPPAKINGGDRVSSLTLRSGREIEVDGVFILRSSVSPERLVPGLETEDGHIRVSRSMETSVPGIFAAGDCTGRPYQYAKASGEGNVAAHAMLELISKGGVLQAERERAYEYGLPEYLQHDLDAYKEGLRTHSGLLDCLWGELYGSINIAVINDGAITPEHADYLRKKFLFGTGV